MTGENCVELVALASYCSYIWSMLDRTQKTLNSSLPMGQVALTFCLPWESLCLLIW